MKIKSIVKKLDFFLANPNPLHVDIHKRGPVKELIGSSTTCSKKKHTLLSGLLLLIFYYINIKKGG